MVIMKTMKNKVHMFLLLVGFVSFAVSVSQAESLKEMRTASMVNKEFGQPWDIVNLPLSSWTTDADFPVVWVNDEVNWMRANAAANIDAVIKEGNALLMKDRGALKRITGVGVQPFSTQNATMNAAFIALANTIKNLPGASSWTKTRKDAANKFIDMVNKRTATPTASAIKPIA